MTERNIITKLMETYCNPSARRQARYQEIKNTINLARGEDPFYQAYVVTDAVYKAICAEEEVTDNLLEIRKRKRKK